MKGKAAGGGGHHPGRTPRSTRSPARWAAAVSAFGGGGASANVTIALKPLSRAAHFGRSSDRTVAAEARARRRREDLPAGRARLRGGGGRSANAQYQYTLLGDDLTEVAHLVAEAAPRAAGHAGGHRRGYRTCSRGTGDRPDRRSRQRLAPGAVRDANRQRAGRCLRPGAGVEHLQSFQPAAISRGHGSGAGVLAEPGDSRETVRQHLRRRRRPARS